MSSSSPPSKEKYRALLTSASKTAGSDNWKTSAGRTDGPDGFVAGDALRLIKIHLFKSTSKPSVCPVCMEKPSSDDEWYITKSCRHAVCRTCLQDYSSSLIADPNHSGPLKCPCCPRLLRVEDAKVALDKRPKSKKKIIPKAVRKLSTKKIQVGGLFADPEGENRINSALEDLEKWDIKKRDELLRSMSSFRPCPHCSNGNGSDTGGSSEEAEGIKKRGGGGFVTPDCLRPINAERESSATRLLNLTGSPSSVAILLMYCIFYLHCVSSKSNNPAVQILLALVPSVLLPILPHALRLFLVSMAKKEVTRPIIVTCPCCLKDFNLDAASEFHHPDSSSDNASEAATQRWKNKNTRPCPRCASPIMKDGGCNHVKCGKCHVDFCWACMRPRTRCRAYACINGAPYGNRSISGGGLAAAEGGRQGVTLMERIDDVESAALRNLRLFRMFPFSYYAAFVGIIATASTIHRILSPVVAFFFSNLHNTVLIVCFILILTHHNRQQRNDNMGANIGIDRTRQHQNGNWVSMQRPRLSFGRSVSRTEEHQLAESIARSLVEQ